VYFGCCAPRPPTVSHEADHQEPQCSRRAPGLPRHARARRNGVRKLADGLSIDEIVTSYPSLSREDVVAVFGPAGQLLVELGEVEASLATFSMPMRLVRESVDVDLKAPLDAAQTGSNLSDWAIGPPRKA
jgi:hypothetical protein